MRVVDVAVAAHAQPLHAVTHGGQPPHARDTRSPLGEQAEGRRWVVAMATAWWSTQRQRLPRSSHTTAASPHLISCSTPSHHATGCAPTAPRARNGWNTACRATDASPPAGKGPHTWQRCGGRATRRAPTVAREGNAGAHRPFWCALPRDPRRQAVLYRTPGFPTRMHNTDATCPNQTLCITGHARRPSRGAHPHAMRMLALDPVRHNNKMCGPMPMALMR